MPTEKAIEIIENYNEWFHFKESEEIAFRKALDALYKCSKIEKIIDFYDADFIANYVRGLFAE